MPTPSESTLGTRMAPSVPVVAETAPRIKRSIFGNYRADLPDAERGATGGSSALSSPVTGAEAPDAAGVALARAFIHQFLARAFEYPTQATWDWLCSDPTRAAMGAAVVAVEPGTATELGERWRALLKELVSERLIALHDDYILAIGHAARGSCPINEIEYGDLRADPLFQPHRLADLAAFYHAFGLEIGARSDERLDHLSVELEFMAVLTAQEATLWTTAAGSEALAVCRDAQRKFLREHLGRWTPAFARRLHRAVADTPLGALALFTLAFVEIECARAGVKAGSEDLLLRPADEAASLCDGCGLDHALPGALGSAASA